MLFISHRLEEVFAICDTVTVMRDGAVVHDAPTSPSMTTDEMVRRMVGRELGGAVPEAGGRDRRARADGPAPHARGRVLRRQLRGPRGRDRRARRASSAPAAARSRARSSGSTAPTPATSRSTAAGCAAGRPLAAMRAGHRVRARGPPHAGPRHGPVDRAQRDAHAHAGARAARADPRRRREPPGARVGAAAAAEVPPPRGPGRLPLGRQPAEGRARQVAGDRAEAADPRRADARHRRRHQGRGAPAA